MEYTAIAKLNDAGEAMLGDAQVVMGDGTTKVQFKNGRATVNAQEAELLSKRFDVEIPGFTPGDVPATDPVPTPLQAGELPPGAVINGDGTITLSAESLTPEQREAVRQALDIQPVQHETSKPQAGDSEAIAAAREYLEQEGEDVPEPEAPVEKALQMPEGFQARTAEGEPRCLARKADSSQCANAAKGDSLACGLAKHQGQFAA